jgi:hypothetical protein
MMPRLLRWVLALVMVAAAVLAAGCADRRYDGAWEGTTSQGFRIRFVVKQGAVTGYVVGYWGDPSGQGMETFGACQVAVESASFSVGEILQGAFASDRDAKGTFTPRPPTRATANVSWTATKQP